jgi:hypothetical protein
VHATIDTQSNRDSGEGKEQRVNSQDLYTSTCRRYSHLAI